MVVCVKIMSKGSNCYSCYCTHVERVEIGVCGLCTQYRYIQCYVERVEKALTVLIITHVTHVKRVKSGVCGLRTQYRYIQCYVKRVERVERLCYVETRDKHIFAHNFLNIQAIFNLKKVLESWDLDLSNAMYVEACWRGQKSKQLLTPLTYMALDGMVGKV